MDAPKIKINQTAKKFTTSLIFASALLFCFSQTNNTPALEREVSVKFENKSAQAILDNIEAQSGVVFSYNPEIVNTFASVSVNENQKPIRYILHEIFGNAINFKGKGKFIILKKNKETLNNLEAKGRKFYIEGYVNASGSGEKLKEVTVYSKDLRVSATTDDYGYFKIELPPLAPRTELHVCKLGYTDTVLMPIDSKPQFVNVDLTPGKPNWTSIIDTTLKKINNIKIPEWFVPENILANTHNLSDTLFTNMQISLLPFISTNSLLTGNTANNLSFNIIAGYTQEVRVAEVGGVINIVRNNLQYMQYAGIGNIVGGKVKGVQIAGYFNFANRIEGIQAAGIINFAYQNSSYAQVSGIGNVCADKFTGFQGTGIFNLAKDFEGMQGAGIVNVSGGASKNVQLAGIANIANHSMVQASSIINVAKNNTIQASGITNVADTSQIQVAGIANIAHYSKKVQVSSIINMGATVEGIQLSMINIDDSCKGIPIGFFSFVKHGYHKIELSEDEMRLTNLSFRTGVNHFYNIFTVGINPFANGPYWTVGIGFGASFRRNETQNFDIDLLTQNMNKGKLSSSENNLYRFYAGMDRKLSSNFSIAYGITCNVLYSKVSPDNPNFDKMVPYSFTKNQQNSNYNLQMWLGVKAGIRFL